MNLLKKSLLVCIGLGTIIYIALLPFIYLYTSYFIFRPWIVNDFLFGSYTLPYIFSGILVSLPLVLAMKYIYIHKKSLFIYIILGTMAYIVFLAIG